MRIHRSLRLLTAAGVLLATVALFLLLLLVSNQVLALWERLQEVPAWLVWLYLHVLAAFAAASGWVLWRLLRPPPAPEPPAEPELSVEALQARIERYRAAGVAVEAAAGELALLAARREGGELFLCFFGEISAGKSSLLKALVPEAAAAVGVLGGTTRDVRHYRWQGPAGVSLQLADVAGFNQAEPAEEAAARAEALRAHVVIYVCDGDLTRAQWQQLELLRTLDKALVVALNKRDRYGASELAALRERLQQRLPGVPVAAVSAGGREELIRVGADGREERIERQRPVDVAELLAALQQLLAQPATALESRRERAVTRLAADQLEQALAAHRREQATAAVDRYTRRAVVGALAAVAPGSDLIIQGALATALVRELAGIYEVSVREVDLDRFLAAARARAGHALPLTLAVAGNGLKAFPGMGTLSGGLLHAVAYGLLFQTLGRAVADSLQRHGTLEPAQALRQFEDELGEDLARRAREVAGMALEQRRRDDRRG